MWLRLPLDRLGALQCNISVPALSIGHCFGVVAFRGLRLAAPPNHSGRKERASRLLLFRFLAQGKRVGGWRPAGMPFEAPLAEIAQGQQGCWRYEEGRARPFGFSQGKQGSPLRRDAGQYQRG